MDDEATRLFDMIGEPALAEIRAHPRLREATELVGRGAVAHFTGLQEPFRSILRDVGAACIGLGALGLQQTPEGLTAAKLISTCVSKGLSSRGRVRAFLNKCFGHDQIVWLDKAEPWTRRRMAIRSGLISAYRDRALVEFEALTIIVPSIAPARALFMDDDTVLGILMWVVRLSWERPDILLNHASNPVMEMFVYRDAGMLMLFDLMLAQPPMRSRLMEAGPISRYRLAKRYGVSRLHVARMLSEAEAHGLMSFPAPGRVVFTPKLSAGLERQSALLMQWLRAGVLAAQGKLLISPLSPATAAA